MTYSEINCKGSFVQLEVVRTSRNANGSLHREMAAREYFETPMGLIPEKEWYALAMQAVLDNGDLPLLKAIKAHCKKNYVWLKNDEEVEHHALKSLVRGAYKAWEERGEFVCPTEKENASTD